MKSEEQKWQGRLRERPESVYQIIVSSDSFSRFMLQSFLKRHGCKGMQRNANDWCFVFGRILSDRDIDTWVLYTATSLMTIMNQPKGSEKHIPGLIKYFVSPYYMNKFNDILWMILTFRWILLNISMIHLIITGLKRKIIFQTSILGFKMWIFRG